MSFKKSFVVILMSLFIYHSEVSAGELYWPEMEYDTTIPRHHDVLGYQTGEKITNHIDMLKYFDALVKAAPEHIQKFSYGKTWEGRELIYLVIGSEQNLAKLREFEHNIQKLADPRITNKKQADQLIKQLPASVWLGYGVHGNEISSTDAAMMTAYHLLASAESPMTKQIMDNTLVFIDPLQNPDGRTRFTSRYYSNVGLEHSGDRYSADHNEPWPNGRSNHYLFDMNRDWLAMTQPETQGRIATMNRYLPLVVIDLHEMGGDSSYYFAPAAEPMNPLMTTAQINNMTLIGKNHAKHFDAMGYDYFTREVFDAFYPGYGDSWPTFYGASASTYEVGSARGEVFIKRNGEKYTYADSVQKHFIASISTIEATGNLRTQLLNDFYQYQVSAIADGKNKQYVVPAQSDRAGAHRLAQLLMAHGVEVHQLKHDIKTCGQAFKSGGFVVDSAQPKGRFVEAVLSQQVDMDQSFIEEQEKRRSRNLRDQIYDLTAWSLPLMFNLEVINCRGIKSNHTTMLNGDMALSPQLSNPDAKVAYLVPWGDMAAGRFLTNALRQGIKIKSSDLPFTLANGNNYPAGTLIIEIENNSNDLAAQVQRIATTTGAVVDGIDSSWVTKGPNFGSGNVVEIPAPKIAMAWDQPTSSLSAGNSRFVIERQLGYPVTAIRSQHLIYADLSLYDVLILPSGNYSQVFNEQSIAHITSWINTGGVLLTLGQATAYAISEPANWLSVKAEQSFKTTADTKPTETEKSSSVPGQLIQNDEEFNLAIQPDKGRPDSVAGVLAKVAVDQDHWLTAGVKPEVIAMVSGSQIYTPIKLDEGKNVAWFKGSDELLASGYLWEENRQQLAYKPFLIHQPKGKGMVIAFTQEPTLRAFLDGLQVMLTNTLFRSVAHTGKLR
ncbi:M14 family zinc carboxypeptidase [Marinicella litoralis]|uniref:Zinc carboxypeptidase n=1 Tax=Marinicella litoralis TaxID=644220 RepID=A0A4R6XSA6_9GAMM|nr:M14 family zinc carboxypeptidase [Marinicella litoralis]TDR22646.1 zinc carboxypeptidase [Marinicella litoralis]